MKREISLFIRWITGKELSYAERVESTYYASNWHILNLARNFRRLILKIKLSPAEFQQLREKEQREDKMGGKRYRMELLISQVPKNWTAKEFLPWYHQDIDDSYSFDGELAFFVSPCQICAHLRSSNGICDAYPDGIPLEIWLKLHDHNEPYPGDKGIRFKLKDGE